MLKGTRSDFITETYKNVTIVCIEILHIKNLDGFYLYRKTSNSEIPRRASVYINIVNNENEFDIMFHFLLDKTNLTSQCNSCSYTIPLLTDPHRPWTMVMLQYNSSIKVQGAVF